MNLFPISIGLLIVAIVLIGIPEMTGKGAGLARFGWAVGLVSLVLLLVQAAGLR